MLHIIFPSVAAPIGTAQPVRPTKTIVDTSATSRIMALKIIGEARLAKGISLSAAVCKNPVPFTECVSHEDETNEGHNADEGDENEDEAEYAEGERLSTSR